MAPSAFGLHLLPGLAVLTDCHELMGHFPLVSTNVNDGSLPGAVIRFVEPSPQPAVPPEDGFSLLAAAEPQLGWRRIRNSFPPDIELTGCDPMFRARAAETAFRLAALLHVHHHGGLLLHAAGLSDGTGAFVCLAPSGGGKSTLTDLAYGYDSLSDETVAVIPDSQHGLWQAWGTTFRSSARKAPVSPRKFPLRGFLILEKFPVPEAVHASPEILARALLGQAYADAPAFTGGRPEQFRKAAALSRTIPAFRFRFPKESGPTVDLLKQLFAHAPG